MRAHEWPTYDIRQLPAPVLRNAWHNQAYDRSVAHARLMEAADDSRGTPRDIERVLQCYDVYTYQVGAYMFILEAYHGTLPSVR